MDTDDQRVDAPGVPEGSTPAGAAFEAVRIRALDTTFRLEVTDSRLAARLRVEWARCLVDGSASTEVPLPVRGGQRWEDGLTYLLASSITRRAIEATVGQHVVFHAAGLVDDSGRTAVLVAPSGTGKTTAAATLARAEFGYVTDETVVVIEDGGVLPYPKPLSILNAPGGKVQYGPDELALLPCPPSPQLGRLVLLDRAAGGGAEPRLERVPLLDAVVALIPQTSALPSLDRPLHRLCEVIDRCGGVYRLTYSEIGDVGTLLRGLLGSVERVTDPWQTLPTSRNGDAPDVGGPARSDLLLQQPYRDGIRVGEEALLLLDTIPLRLSSLGLTLWRRARGGALLSDLVEAAVRDHGPHPDAEEVVRAAVEGLLASQALRPISGVGGVV